MVALVEGVLMSQVLQPREAGFYWVRLGPGWKTRGAWVVAERDDLGWQVMDEMRHYPDSEFDEIRDPPLRGPHENH